MARLLRTSRLGMCLAAWVFACVLLLGAQVRAQGVNQAQGSALLLRPLQPDYIIARLAERNQQLESYQAHLYVAFRLRSFPYFREHLEGTASFKRPGTYQIAFNRVPRYAHGFSHLTADLADAGEWPRRFVISVVGTRDFEGHHDIVLQLVARVRGQIDHQDVVVNPTLWEVDQMEYHYYNGGTISMQQHFATLGKFRLIVAQDAQIQIPFVRAVAHADYTQYHTNVALQ